MKRITRGLLFAWGLALLLTACATTSVAGKNNEAYDSEEAASEEAAAKGQKDEVKKIIFKVPDKTVKLQPYYFAINLPGIKPTIYAFSDDKGEIQYRAYAYSEVEEKDGFFAVTIQPVKDSPDYSFDLADEQFVKHEDEKPGIPITQDDKMPESVVFKDRWMPVKEMKNLHAFPANNGEYNYRRWASLGENEAFYPSNDIGIMIRGGLPDAVKIGDEWIDVAVLNALTFPRVASVPELPEEETEATEELTEAARTEQEDTEVRYVEPVRTEPWRTDPPRTEAPRTEPRTEAPRTDPPRTERPKTEAPRTEAPRTEAPRTEPPRTEPPRTEPPQTEPPETEPTWTPPEWTEPPEETEPEWTEPQGTYEDDEE